MKLILADADIGLVPLAAAPDGEPGAVLLHRSGLLAALDALFETTWQQRTRSSCRSSAATRP